MRISKITVSCRCSIIYVNIYLFIYLHSQFLSFYFNNTNIYGLDLSIFISLKRDPYYLVKRFMKIKQEFSIKINLYKKLYLKIFNILNDLTTYSKNFQTSFDYKPVLKSNLFQFKNRSLRYQHCPFNLFLPILTEK